MSFTVAQIVSMVQAALPVDVIPTEEMIRDHVTRIGAAFGVDKAVCEEAIATVTAQRLVKMDTGYALREDHVPWVNARRAEIDPYYWTRFKQWLNGQGWPPFVMQGLDRSTDDVLDLLGNPAEEDTWKRRGLVLGDVQSGKTATYSALICKAADAGYRFIVLLTGTIENLRRQTQERLDAGFVGRDSSEALKRNRQDIHVGVGRIDRRRSAVVFTSSANDFKAQTVDALGLSLASLREPAIVVIKKHTRILKNLSDWVRSHNSGPGNAAIDLPLLVIDDEADNASINTNDEGCDPTRVNAGIRELLKQFRRTTYVGFTATPFANIFVNPDSSDEMYADDLFPRDFIYTLQAPTNYFGARRVFIDEEGSRSTLRVIEDVEEAIPTKHRSNLAVTTLPPSLIDALCAFFLSNAIRDLRREGPTHRSMLVNVSQFTAVQDQVEQLIGFEISQLQADIRNYAGLSQKKALANRSLARLHQVWEREFKDCGFDWPKIQGALKTSTLPITSTAVNQRTGSRALDYKTHKEHGLRVVAVGGNSLSRGLTLEGLAISYFRRSTKMYDTLLQMGRWFGYRPNYEDLCRVWLPQSAIDWYGYISTATDELRDELRRMHRLNRSPKDFGLAVRASPDSLTVTARNKMRTATEVVRVISVSEQGFESVELPTAIKKLQDNWTLVSNFVKKIVELPGVSVAQTKGTRVVRGVPRQEVAALLRSFRVPETEFRFQPDAIAALLSEMRSDTCGVWDVAIPTGDVEREATLGPFTFNPLKRMVRLEEGLSTFAVSGSKRRVGSRGVEQAGMSDEERAEARRLAVEAEAAKPKKPGEAEVAPERINVSDRFLRQARSVPLLLLHVFDPTLEKQQVSDGLTMPDLHAKGAEYVALGLSFPPIPDGEAVRQATYKINLIKAREILVPEEEIGDDETFSEDAT